METQTMPETIAYIPEWERPDCPTGGMTADAMFKYYKRTAPLGDAKFYAWVWRATEPDLARQVRVLAEAMQPWADAGKAIPRRFSDQLPGYRAEYWRRRRLTEPTWQVPITETPAYDPCRDADRDPDAAALLRSETKAIEEILERRQILLDHLTQLEGLLPEYVRKAASFGRSVLAERETAGVCLRCGKQRKYVERESWARRPSCSACAAWEAEEAERLKALPQDASGACQDACPEG